MMTMRNITLQWDVLNIPNVENQIGLGTLAKGL